MPFAALSAAPLSLAYVVLCGLVFAACWGLTIVTTSVGYHRALAHGAVELRRPWRRLLVASGIWLTGIDPKAWVVMHRLHHAHADTPDDPHAPRRVGVLGFLGMFREQLLGYHRVLEGLRADDPRYTSLGHDLEMSWPARTRRTSVAVVPHVALATAIVALGGGWLLAAALFFGMMLSHLVQGAMINYFGHAHGGRNFATNDNSRNHHLAAWLALGEGFQNNHHRHPSSARFSYQKGEVDPGYGACLVLEKLGVLQVNRRTLAPRAGHAPRVGAVVDERAQPLSR